LEHQNPATDGWDIEITDVRIIALDRVTVLSMLEDIEQNALDVNINRNRLIGRI